MVTMPLCFRAQFARIRFSYDVKSPSCSSNESASVPMIILVPTPI